MDPERPIGVVIEGGGMRGAFAAGATIETWERLKDRIGGLFATSSGAGTAAYAAAMQPEGLDIWKDHLHGSRLVRPWQFVFGRAALNVDYLIDTVFRSRVPLDVEALRRFPGPFEVTATRADTGEPHVFNLHRDDAFEALRATASLPGAVRRAVMVGGHPYVDGGVTDPIPIEGAFRTGFREIIVILTRPPGYRKPALGRLGRSFGARDFPGLAEALARQAERYNESIEKVFRPPAGIRTTVIQPPADLRISRWTRSRSRLLRAIECGRAQAALALGASVEPREGRFPPGEA